MVSNYWSLAIICSSAFVNVCFVFDNNNIFTCFLEANKFLCICNELSSSDQ